MRRRIRRRDFLRFASAGAGALAAGSAGLGSGLALGGCGDASRAGAVAPAGDPAAVWVPDSMSSISGAELDLPLTVLAGKLPRDLQGHHFLQTCVHFDDDSSILNGPALLWRLDLSPGGVQLKTRLLRTDDWFVDQAAAGTPYAYQNLGITRVGPFGVRNFANTALVPMGDRLLATYDAGRPHLIDPTTLEVVSPVGRNREWRPGLSFLQPDALFPGHFTSAHPVADPEDGQLYCPCFAPGGFGGSTFVEIAVWDGRGDVRRTPILAPDGTALVIRNGMHQIGVSREHVVFCDTSFVSTLDGRNPAVAPQETDFFVVRKADLGEVGGARAVHFRLPREAIHFLTDHDDSGGRLTIHVSHTSAQSTSWVGLEDVGAFSGRTVDPRHWKKGIPAGDIGLLGRYVLDVAGARIVEAAAVHESPVTFGLGLYACATGAQVLPRHDVHFWATSGFAPDLMVQRVADVIVDYPNRIVPLAELGRQARPSHLFRFDAQAMRVSDAYEMPAGYMAMSPQMAPARGRSGPGEGYLVVSVASDQPDGPSSGDEFWIFDARDLGRGPVCRLGHPQIDFPFTIHTAWLETLPAADRSYWIDPADDYAAALAILPADARRIGEAALTRGRG